MSYVSVVQAKMNYYNYHLHRLITERLLCMLLYIVIYVAAVVDTTFHTQANE